MELILQFSDRRHLLGLFPLIGASREDIVTGSPQLHGSRATNVVQLPPTPINDEFSLTSLTKKALADAGVLVTWQAMAAVKLAELIDSNHHGHSGAAQNVKAHREAMGVALASAGQTADVVDMIFRS